MKFLSVRRSHSVVFTSSPGCSKGNSHWTFVKIGIIRLHLTWRQGRASHVRLSGKCLCLLEPTELMKICLPGHLCIQHSSNKVIKCQYNITILPRQAQVARLYLWRRPEKILTVLRQSAVWPSYHHHTTSEIPLYCILSWRGPIKKTSSVKGNYILSKSLN